MKYGLIAGNGRFPFLVLEGAKTEGISLTVAAIREEADPAIANLASRVEWISVGHLGRLIKFLKREEVTHVVMAGQVKHVQIFKLNALPDLRMARMLARLPRRSTDALIGAVAGELEAEGIVLIDSTRFLRELLATAGVLTRRLPSRHERSRYPIWPSGGNRAGPARSRTDDCYQGPSCGGDRGDGGNRRCNSSGGGDNSRAPICCSKGGEA